MHGQISLISLTPRNQGMLDNLLKGAATQCLQNINLSLGFDEYAGIPLGTGISTSSSLS